VLLISVSGIYMNHKTGVTKGPEHSFNFVAYLLQFCIAEDYIFSRYA
jgi:hypothetical protein